MTMFSILRLLCLRVLREQVNQSFQILGWLLLLILRLRCLWECSRSRRRRRLGLNSDRLL